jgi:catechol 1,2-dioxygenase
MDLNRFGDVSREYDMKWRRLNLIGVVALFAVIVGFGPSDLTGLVKARDEVRIAHNWAVQQTSEATASPTPVETMAATAPATNSPTARTCSPSSRGGTITEPVDPAPERTSVGTGFVLTGAVLSSPDCKPIAQAKIIFWLAAPNGQYDDAHRATVITDENGEFRFESSFPGQYQGMRPHIHLQISVSGYRSLETEYLPNTGDTTGTMEIVLAPLPTPTPTATSTATGTAEGTRVSR